MLLQEEVERQAKAALGQPSCAVMASRTTICKQPAARFAGIEIFGPNLCRAQRRHNAERQENTAPQRHFHHAPQTI
jgi:hypothetical protein